MTETTILARGKKPQSEMLTRFKQAANPYYHATFGIALNNVSVWEKHPDMQFIFVWSGGSRFIFIGEDARSVLYNLGDHNSSDYREVTAEERQIILNHINGVPNSEPQQVTPEA